MKTNDKTKRPIDEEFTLTEPEIEHGVIVNPHVKKLLEMDQKKKDNPDAYSSFSSFSSFSSYSSRT